MDAALEVAVARQHAGDDEVALLDLLRDVVGQRARVPDAGRAAVADQVEAQRRQRLDQVRALEVLGHDLRSRRERGLDPAACARARPRPPSWPASPAPIITERVRGVGAARDGRDHDGPVPEARPRARPPRCPAAGGVTDLGDSPPPLFVGGSLERERLVEGLVVAGRRLVAGVLLQLGAEVRGRVRRATRSCGRLGPRATAQRWQGELKRVGVGLLESRVEEALLLAVASTSSHQLGRPAETPR